jgi:hypothetical protein
MRCRSCSAAIFMLTRHFDKLAARRPWLLLWVLPYLLLAVAGESLHNHGFGEQPKAPPAFLGQSVSADLSGAEQPALFAHEGCAPSGSAHSLPHCLSCQWSSQSVGVPPVASTAGSQLCVCPVASSAERTFVSSFVGLTSTRGPPLS